MGCSQRNSLLNPKHQQRQLRKAKETMRDATWLGRLEVPVLHHDMAIRIALHAIYVTGHKTTKDAPYLVFAASLDQGSPSFDLGSPHFWRRKFTLVICPREAPCSHFVASFIPETSILGLSQTSTELYLV